MPAGYALSCGARQLGALSPLGGVRAQSVFCSSSSKLQMLPPALWMLALWMALLLVVYVSTLSCTTDAVKHETVAASYVIRSERQRWGSLRSTPCDGIELPRAASIGSFEGRTVPLLRTLGHRDELAVLANQLNLTGTAAELGVFRGEFSEKNLKKWRGALYVMIDSWRPSDCINGNSSHCVYGAGYDREQYDLRETKLRMARNPGFERRHRIVQNTTAAAAALFADGSLDWIYLDATHTYAEARQDLETWYTKVRPGGLVSGHDYQYVHQEMGDGYTFGVKDAVDEFAARRGIRVYLTTEPYLPSFYFMKC
eukprot:Transcript_18687.p1 GENE.Transcript_18687~~Transcript_18687.p1  ORF type:complete len:312 (+),score=79.95 Transcript_18687:94-1029(+)